MMIQPKSQAMALALILVASADANALEGKFRGTYVCAKLPTTRGILRAPIDLVVHDNAVQFARPLFNLNGARVVGTELAAGTIDGDGAVHLTSEWSFLGNTSKATYTGTITSTGGTLTGRQIWSGPGDAATVSRPCTAAVVPTPDPSDSPRPDGQTNSTGHETEE